MGVRYNRVGACNRCGLCCGAQRAQSWPDRRSPFPRGWPEYIRHEPQETLDLICPHLRHFGLEQDVNGEWVKGDPPYGDIKVGPKRFYYVWVKPDTHGVNAGLCKDTSAAHDGSQWEPECPFLDDDPGDGTRPCGLVGTNIESQTFGVWCEPEPTYPRSEELKNEWVWRYGEGSVDGEHCSYTWELIPE